MRNSLIAMTHLEGPALVLHVDEIRRIEEYGHHSRIVTHDNSFVIEENMTLIMSQWQGNFSPEFTGDPTRPDILCPCCEEKAKKAANAVATAGELAHAKAVIGDNLPELPKGPTIHDLGEKLSVRGMNIVHAAYESDFTSGGEVDFKTIPLCRISAITEADWAAKKHSSPEVAQQICHWIKELRKPAFS